MSQPQPNAKTRRELDEERNAIGNCPHPDGAIVVDEHVAGSGVQRFCNCCESYL